MLHNLFHSLPCIHTLSGSKSLHSADMTSTTTYVEPPFFEYCLSDMSLNKYTLLSFFLYDTWFFFDIVASVLTHIPCHKSSSCWSPVSRPNFYLFLPVYLLSSLHFLFLYSIHICISTYHWYLRICEFFLFLIYKNPLRSLHFFFETVTFVDIVSTFNVLHSFFLASCFSFFTSLLSQLCIIFFDGATHSLLSLAFYVCWLISTLLSSNCSLGRACITTPSVHRDNIFAPFFILPRDLDWFLFFLPPLLTFISIHVVYSPSLFSTPGPLFFHFDNCDISFYSFFLTICC